MVTIAYFDIETQYLFSDIGERTPSKLKIAFAGVLFGEEIYFFTESNVNELVTLLKKADLIVGHNLFKFDYIVLEPYVDASTLVSLKSKSFDTFADLLRLTGCYIGLDDLGKRNVGFSKTLDGKQIPSLWREGKHKEVKEYLANDLKLTKGVYQFGKTHKSLRYDYKEFGVSKGEKLVNVNW